MKSLWQIFYLRDFDHPSISYKGNPLTAEAFRRLTNLAGKRLSILGVSSKYRPLSKARTVEAFGGADPFALEPIDELVDFSVGGVLAITPECWWAAGGMDERYVDWGCEDFAFADAAGAALGPVLRVDGPAVHLWHPHAGDPTNPDQQANSRLLAGGER